jgi:transposase
MTAEETIASLTAQLKEAVERLREATEDLRQTQEQLHQTQEHLHAAQKRITELEKLKTPKADFVKANKKKKASEEKKPRKKRDAQYNHARRRATPTQIVEHRIVQCPDCHLRLGGISLARVREVIDVPPPPPLEITEHRVYKGWCAQCQRWHEAPVDLAEQVLGQGRIGVRLSSLMAYLRSVMRLPIRQLREVMRQVYGLDVSIGEIVELLHRIHEHAQPVLTDLKKKIRSSPAVQADETGWREDGSNGYIWSVSTPQIRYYEYHHSRAGEVVKQLIGDDFAGVLGSDFYAGYNIHQGLHQRCWVHYLRDVHDLKKACPDNEDLSTWAKAVKDLYEEAVTWATHGPDPGLSPRQHHQARVEQQHAFEQRLWALCHPYVHTPAPQQTVCKRVEQFLPELFVFVAIAGVPAHNNLAERSIRPLVIARKISGGTRSPKGSQTRMGLASLFGTWMAQGLNPFSQCLALLTSTSSLC